MICFLFRIGFPCCSSCVLVALSTCLEWLYIYIYYLLLNRLFCAFQYMFVKLGHSQVVTSFLTLFKRNALACREFEIIAFFYESIHDIEFCGFSPSPPWMISICFDFLYLCHHIPFSTGVSLPFLLIVNMIFSYIFTIWIIANSLHIFLF